MTKSQLLATGAVGLLAVIFVVSNLSAQGNGVAPAGQPLGSQPVYLLDINYVFKNHSKLKALKTDMQGDVARAEERVKNEKETIKKLQERLAEYKPGTQDYKNLEQEIATRMADLNVLITLQRKEFLQQEARIYYTIYKEIYDEVSYFAQQNRAAMVLKFDREPINVEEPETVVRAINKQVIWNNQGLDITDYILDTLNRRLQSGGTSPGASRPMVPPRAGYR